MAREAGLQMTHVPYTAPGQATTNLISNEIQAMFQLVPGIVGQVKAGTVRPLAVLASARSPALPDVPTTAEGGMPQFQVSAWNALFAPKGTPKEVVAKLNDALAKALDDATTRKRLLDLGGILPDGAGRTPGALGDLVKKEVARWTPILKATGAVGE